MQIVIIVTIVFFVLTLAGTWLARRSAYTWADNERAMGNEADASRPETRVDAPGPGRSTDQRTPGTRQPTRSTQIVVTGFDTPTKD
ncbi:MAG: hypothetical protein KF902_00135 [Phycisphaeraceae bacterium]|nr:hypothetical protein [Phycisphaeraceae bacterium]